MLQIRKWLILADLFIMAGIVIVTLSFFLLPIPNLYTYIKCLIGIILFIIDLIQKKHIQKERFPLMVPSVLVSVFIFYEFIKNYETMFFGFDIVLSIGGLLWSIHWLVFYNDIFATKKIRLFFCILFPLNVLVLYICAYAAIGI
jgi:hypothetical protein